MIIYFQVLNNWMGKFFGLPVHLTLDDLFLGAPADYKKEKFDI
jgi:hypothetical protein